MTEENYKYRTSDLFLRNQFEGTGEFNIPLIPKSNFSNEELLDLLLIGFIKLKMTKIILIGWCISSFMIINLKVYGINRMLM